MGGGDRRQDRQDQTPFYSERTWILSAAFLVGTLLLAGMVWLTQSADESTVAPTAEAAPQVQECPPGPTVASGKAVQPADLKWQTIDVGYRMPVSTTHGPALQDGELLRCFAHTPMGAVLAAHIIPITLNGPDGLRVAQLQVAPTVGQRVLLTRLSRDSAGTTARTGGGTYVGFAVDRYSPETAVVQLLVKGTAGYTASRVVLRWEDGDWKVALSTVGDSYQSLGVVTGSAGFTLWRE
ncbi:MULTISPECIES: hypothetical protein [Micromonospora]|uniref:DUF8175 domain-containing protein n=1 Tax=Micromonospora yangpuensis TaxID=683228 RepID=A0A1C6V3B5_9ACTN|nr:hypothetical protein [Micromonospora yangpuensis]GGM14730.1 hypothetical protein GCM10012279_36100 [Micromonospora yangpuensis]SCL60718.1 hypothetical protein GA0070617_4456 [Micromonospora yangpuensis]